MFIATFTVVYPELEEASMKSHLLLSIKNYVFPIRRTRHTCIMLFDIFMEYLWNTL